jgi:homopolymeric O-antigen transport system permease protein
MEHGTIERGRAVTPPPPASAPVTELRRSTKRFPGPNLRELWAYRDVGYFLALRDLKLRYKQTVFGVGWAVIQPVAGAVVFALILGRAAGLPSDGLPYGVFVYTGLVVWTYFSTGLNAVAMSLVDQRELVEKLYFPRLLAPLAAAAPGLLDFAISLAVLAIFMVVGDVAPGPALALLPVWVIAAVLVVVATGLWLSALNVQYRDVKYALTFLIQLWLFASPVVFPSSIIDGTARWVYSANPAVGVIDGFRWSAIGGPPPVAADLMSLATGLLLLVTGTIYFRRAERRFADVI